MAPDCSDAEAADQLDGKNPPLESAAHSGFDPAMTGHPRRRAPVRVHSLAGVDPGLLLLLGGAASAAAAAAVSGGHHQPNARRSRRR